MGRPMREDEREAAYEARREAAPVVVLVPALFVVLAVVSGVQGWEFLGLSWWLWLVLVVPSLLLAVDLWLGVLRRGFAKSRRAALVLLAVMFVGNLAGLVVLVAELVSTGGGSFGGGELLFTAATIWMTNVIVFGITFWGLDNGGPVKRALHERAKPDFQFPQDQTAGDERWRPRVWDYLYLSLTNSTAFSPTDALPLTGRAKLLMGIEGVLSLIIVVLVTARAVNVLGS
jgi:uncharacterized membrane protein